jgi:hypothetical protein
MNDNEPLKVGDRVRLRHFPHITGTIWDVSRNEDMVIVDWGNPEDDVYDTALRGFIERTAHAVAFADALLKIKTAPVDGPLTPVLELSEVIHEALYATQREWDKLIEADFRKASVKELKYVKKEHRANMLSENIPQLY